MTRVSGSWQIITETLSRITTAVAIIGLIANPTPDSIKITRTDPTIRVGNTKKARKILVGGRQPREGEALEE
jgi:hypothetical protein